MFRKLFGIKSEAEKIEEMNQIEEEKKRAEEEKKEEAEMLKEGFVYLYRKYGEGRSDDYDTFIHFYKVPNFDKRIKFDLKTLNDEKKTKLIEYINKKHKVLEYEFEKDFNTNLEEPKTEEKKEIEKQNQIDNENAIRDPIMWFENLPKQENGKKTALCFTKTKKQESPIELFEYKYTPDCDEGNVVKFMVDLSNYDDAKKIKLHTYTHNIWYSSDFQRLFNTIEETPTMGGKKRTTRRRSPIRKNKKTHIKKTNK